METDQATVEAIVRGHARNGGTAGNVLSDLLETTTSCSYIGWAVAALEGRAVTFEVGGAMITVALVPESKMADVRRSLEGSVKPPVTELRAGILFAARIALKAAFISTALAHGRLPKQVVGA